MNKDEDSFSEEAEDNDLPAIERKIVEMVPEHTVTLAPFIPVSVQDDDDATTQSDLNFLNNNLALLDATIPSIRTLNGLLAMINTSCRVIETRRKVKKLPFGEKQETKGMRSFPGTLE